MEENVKKTPQIPENQGPKPSDSSFHKIPVIRTYENDIAEALAQKKISSASISIAEADARRRENSAKVSEAIAKDIVIPVAPKPSPPQTPHPPPTPPPSNIPRTPRIQQNVPPKSVAVIEDRKNIFKLLFKPVLSVILICLGIWGGYYLYTLSPFAKEFVAPANDSTTGNTIAIPSIVTPNTQKVIDISAQNPQEILSLIRQKENTGGALGMLGLVFEETTRGQTGQTAQTAQITQVTASQFITAVGINPPDALTTSLDTTWMFGVDSVGSYGPAPFVIFTTNFFQNTFAGMLAWEPTMPRDLSSLLGFSVGVSGKYEDRILNNKNIREFVDASSSPVFLYGFIDNKTLVIARSEPAFSDIVNRIEKQTYVR